MTKPMLLVKVEPTYPDVARMARLSGRVTISAVIGLDGSVESAEVLASTSPLFSDTAIGAVRKWRYRPALMNGKPVRVYFTVVVDFSLR
jgi:protein TonB